MILTILAAISFLDSLFLISPLLTWSYSYQIFFKNLEPVETRSFDFKLTTSDISFDDKLSTHDEVHMSYLSQVIYISNRVILGILGFLYVKLKVVNRAIEDAKNGDIWWSILGLSCLILPSIPIAMKYLQKRIAIIQSQDGALRVKEFLKLFLATLSYFLGGFVLFAIYRMGLKLYFTAKNIADTTKNIVDRTGKISNLKYRKKEMEMNLHQVALESAPDGLLTVSV